MDELRDRLDVRVVGARNLLEVEGGPASPYLDVILGQDREVTSIQESTTEPTWEAELLVFMSIASRLQSELVLIVRHKDVLTSTEATLGMAIVDLATVLGSPEITWEAWHPLRKIPGMHVEDSRLGEILVRVTYFISGMLEEEMESLPEQSMDISDGYQELAGKAPNFLTISVHAGRYLIPPTGKTVCDSIVVVKCAGHSKTSKKVLRSNFPKWNFACEIPNADPTEVLQFSVYHMNAIGSKKLIGICSLTMVEIANVGNSSLMQWTPLLSENSVFDKKGRGEVLITASWMHKSSLPHESNFGQVKRILTRNRKQEKGQQELIGLVEDFAYDDKSEYDERLMSDEEFEEESAEIEAEETMRQDRAARSIQEYEEKLSTIKPGEYQVQIHVIEARELKGENADGTSDPVVYISCLNKRKHTRKRKGVISAVFDEVLYFNFEHLTRDELNEAIILVRVLDRNTIFRDELIGTCQFDLLDVYMQPNHEVYRQWVALHDNESIDDQGIQGYLKLSVVVLASKDRQTVHNLEEEVLEERANEASSGGLGGLLLSGPVTTRQTLNFLVVYVRIYSTTSIVHTPLSSSIILRAFQSSFQFMAEDLPNFSSVGTPSINATVAVNFCGNPTIRTKPSKAKGKESLDVAFMQELWLPVMYPPHSKRIDMSVGHKELTGMETFAHLYFNLDNVVISKSGDKDYKKGVFVSHNMIEKAKAKHYNGPPLEWHNLYGSRCSKSQGNKIIALQNKYPSLGTAHRGRVLISMRVEQHPPAKMGHCIVRKDMKYSLPTELIPATQKCTLRVATFQGSDIPIFKLPTGIAKMRIQVCIGSHKMTFKFRKNHRGVVEWNQIEEMRFIPLPLDPRAIPDVFIYLIRASPEVIVSYTKIKAVNLLPQKFEGKPCWYELQADASRQGVLTGIRDVRFPGSILLKVGLGKDSYARSTLWVESRRQQEQIEKKRANKITASTTTEEKDTTGGSSSADEESENWGHNALSGKKVPYCLRVHIFQCKSLPSGESSGLLDPYVKVRFMGQKRKTRTEMNTLEPAFYETLEFHDMIPHDLLYAPDVRLEIWDHDTLANNTHIASCRFSLSSASITKRLGPKAPVPKWHKLRDTNGKPGAGEILTSIQLPKPPSITPTFRTAYLEVISLGVRDLKPYNIQAVSNPYISFELTTGKGRLSFSTAPSKTPRAKNANFLERTVRTVLIPEDPIYCPQLTVRVYDHRLGGVMNPIVGTARLGIEVTVEQPRIQSTPTTGEMVKEDTYNLAEQEEGSDEVNEGKGREKSGGYSDGSPAIAAADSDSIRGETLETTGILTGGGAEKEQQHSTELKSRGAHNTKLDIEVGRGGVHLGYHQGLGDYEDPFQTTGGMRGVGAFELDGEEGAVELPPIWEDEFGEEQTAGRRKRSEMKELMNQKRKEDKQSQAEGHATWYKRLIKQQTSNLGVFDGDEDARIDFDELGIIFPKEWASSEFMDGRDWWLRDSNGGGELEDYLKYPPFENYELFLGSEKLKRGFRFGKRRYRRVGVFKGLIVVTEHQPSNYRSDYIDVNLLRKPQLYVARLYIVKGVRLQPKDLNGFADPYITFKIGKYKVNDREGSLQLKTLEPGFYKTYEFPVTIPGESQLRIKHFDYDRFSNDDLIGQTVIDLEDRLFSSEWRNIGTNHAQAYMKGPMRPMETRDLWSPSSSIPQGHLVMWLELLSGIEARRYPVTPLEHPTPLTVEVRIICWRSKDVVSMDEWSGLNDLYAKFWLETKPNIQKDTDTHWRCKNGKGCWNYRIKFDIELPLKSPEKGRLGVQLWDRDILKWNDFIAQANIDLYPWLLMVYHERRSIKPFQIIREARKRKEVEYRERIENGAVMLDQSSEFDDDNGSHQQDLSAFNDEKGGEMSGDWRHYPHFAVEDNEFHDDEESISESHKLLDNNNNSKASNNYGNDNTKYQAAVAPVSSIISKGEHLKAKQKAKQKVDDTEELVEQIKEFLGIGEIPPDSHWFHLTKTENSETEDMGSLLLSIELLPKDLAESVPVGTGRSEPNLNPYLPPPTGRMTFSFNPFRMASQLLGPKLFYRIMGCCCCLLLTVVLTLLGQYLANIEILFGK